MSNPPPPLSLFDSKVSGTGASRIPQNITLYVSGSSACEFQISKLSYIFKRINKTVIKGTGKVCGDSQGQKSPGKILGHRVFLSLK